MIKKYRLGISSELRENWYTVEFVDSDPIIIRCECCLFETNGILCKHCLHILCKKQITNIPDYYILKRWTVQARNIQSYGSPEMSTISSVTPVMKWNLTGLFNKLVEKCSKSDEAFKELFDYINQKIEEFDVDSSVKVPEIDKNQSHGEDTVSLIIHDPITIRTKGRPKSASRIHSGIEISKENCKKRTCGACGEKEHYSTCPKKPKVRCIFNISFNYS